MPSLSKRYRLLRRRLAPTLKEMGLTLYVLRKNPLAVSGFIIIVAFYFIAIFGGKLAPYDPYEPDLAHRFSPPTTSHLLGTDKMGRDILSRLLVGARHSAIAQVIILSLAVPTGVLLGGIAGYLGGWVDEVVLRITDIFLSFPSLILAMAVSAAIGPGLKNAMAALALVWWPLYTRLVRGQVLAVRESLYVEAARSRGANNWMIIRKHVLPNCLSPILVTLTLDMGAVVLQTAALSFLGFGAQPPLAEWGRMVSDGRLYLFQAWWVSAFPGLAIMLLVLGFNLLGDGVRDALDPKLRRLTEVR